MKPQFGHLPVGFGLPHSEQNLPLFFAPQLHTQTVVASGRGLPQAVQNLPVLPVWPQEQAQPDAGAAVFGLLVIYSLKDVSILGGSHGIPELIAIAVVAVLHLWKRQMLLSIAGGTILYMVLVQLVFLI